MQLSEHRDRPVQIGRQDGAIDQTSIVVLDLLRETLSFGHAPQIALHDFGQGQRLVLHTVRAQSGITIRSNIVRSFAEKSLNRLAPSDTFANPPSGP